MTKMQNVHFKNVEEFLEYLPEAERKIVDHLREIVLECIPECREKLAYNVPYYYKNSRICYIWPSSVPWGNVKLSGVQFGFCRGHLLQDDIGFLEKGKRKEVFFKTYFSGDDIDEDLLRTFIFEAAEVDEQYPKVKSRKLKP